MLQRHNGLHRAGEGKLHRATDLAAVGAQRHHRAKSTHVKEVLAHPFARLAHLIGAAFALFFDGFLLLCVSCYVFSSVFRRFLGGYSQI